MILSKIDAAKIQLDAAIDHFFKDDHICSVTLAGAAEDIMAGLLQAKNGQGAFDFLHDWYQREYSMNYSKRDFSRQIANLPRNWLKHAQEDFDTELNVSRVDSIMMIMRAVPCYVKLVGSHTDKMGNFYDYVNSNIDDIDKWFS